MQVYKTGQTKIKLKEEFVNDLPEEFVEDFTHDFYVKVYN